LNALAAAAVSAGPMRWSGFYAGGHVGGAWSDNRWSDPFGSTTSAGLVNVAGFGDTIHGTGPLAGVQAGINWQTGSWVVGFQADWSKTDIRGENTCFSGIGGMNCQQIINAVATLAGRAGFAWDRALAYAKAGAAAADLNYLLLGNTAGDTRGTGTTQFWAWGWTVGGGLEYALSDHWTAMIEYEHISLNNAVSFPAVASVNTQSLSIRQSIDTLKLGVNYKFDWPQWPAGRS
jgi:opacity protein-like surface antigen